MFYHDEDDAPCFRPFYRDFAYCRPLPPGEDGIPYQRRLSRFRGKDGWKWIELTLRYWREFTVKSFGTGTPRPDLYPFITKLICMWADGDLGIHPTPIRLVGELLEREKHLLYGCTMDPDPTAIGIDSDEAAVLLRDAIVVWERIYDVSEGKYAPKPKPVKGGKRPAYLRDHRWLKWNVEEKLTPAKIRDRWNNMDEFSRDMVCPTQCEALKAGRLGRQVVEHALKTARKEKKGQK